LGDYFKDKEKGELKCVFQLREHSLRNHAYVRVNLGGKINGDEIRYSIDERYTGEEPWPILAGCMAQGNFIIDYYFNEYKKKPEAGSNQKIGYQLTLDIQVSIFNWENLNESLGDLPKISYYWDESKERFIFNPKYIPQ
jgi:hypothetical protein